MTTRREPLSRDVIVRTAVELADAHGIAALTMRRLEEVLDGLIRRGLDERHAVSVYKVFTSFLLGHLLLEVSVRGADTGPAEEPLDEGGADVPNADQDHDLADYPTVQRLR